ncbi:MAG: hypothetical protein U9M98_02915 [Patescibacteria group bacterium]|nr:hypothetical protein [Patescibacteria group bacterium]
MGTMPGRSSVVNNGTAVDKARKDLEALNAIAPTSRQVEEVLETFADGLVKVYGDPGSRATRTEIVLDDALVVFHANTGVGEGMFASKAYPSEIEVIVNEHTYSLRIVPDPQTSAFNPIYIFFDGDEKIGLGHGQRMDLQLASGLLETHIGGASDRVPTEVFAWIRRKLS